MGGALAAIENGFVHNEIESAAYVFQKAVESGGQVVVGVNQFTVDDGEMPELLRVDPAIESQQRARLAKLRAERDNERVSSLRDQLAQAARGTENLMPIIVECVDNEVTLGEVSHTLRGVFGEYRPSV
jgi:methylmalonyl-CoA mutase N-terminal domain/subunit